MVAGALCAGALMSLNGSVVDMVRGIKLDYGCMCKIRLDYGCMCKIHYGQQ
jgi:hypothetical protein